MSDVSRAGEVRSEHEINDIHSNHLLQWQNVDDEELMVYAQRGYHYTFEILIRRHQKFLLCTAKRYLGCIALAQDIVQEVFLTLWKNRSQYKAVGLFRSFLITLTMNRCRDFSRKNKTMEKYLLFNNDESRNCTDDSSSAEHRIIHSDLVMQVNGLLSRLEERKKEVIILRYIQELSINEISQRTGMPVGTVKSLLSRGIKQLCKMVNSDCPSISSQSEEDLSLIQSESS